MTWLSPAKSILLQRPAAKLVFDMAARWVEVTTVVVENQIHMRSRLKN